VQYHKLMVFSGELLVADSRSQCISESECVIRLEFIGNFFGSDQSLKSQIITSIARPAPLLTYIVIFLRPYLPSLSNPTPCSLSSAA